MRCFPFDPSQQLSKGNSKYATSWFEQTHVLCRRSFRNSTRTWAYFISWILGLAMFLFYGTLYLGYRPFPSALQCHAGATLQVVTPEDIQFQDSVAGFLYQILAGVIFLHLDDIGAGTAPTTHGP